MKRKLTIRKATLEDGRGIHALISKYAKRGLMLPRSLNNIYENIRDYFVYTNRKGKVVACAALHVVWEDLAEVKALAVEKDYQKRGLGSGMVLACLREAKKMAVPRVFVLTYAPSFFKSQGFEVTDKAELPQKIWGECIHCPLFPDCNETALVYEF
ncbi:MAG: N-acetyltransferase [Candidatus Omnitrophica bacterium]|nr:N-acetyltransferase [Candidatus Omnitrophota bacterium]